MLTRKGNLRANLIGRLVVGAAAFAAVLALSAKASAAQAQYDEKYFEIKSVTVSEVSQPSVAMTAEPLCNSSTAPKVEDGSVRPNYDGINLNDIINLGRQIWTIIEKNQPVVNLKVQKADALPVGVSSWGELECWQVPESRLYKVSYKNLLGMEVVNLVLRVGYTYGGRINGQGRYLSQVTVLPAQLDVSWGFKLDAEVKVANVTNAGTRANPVAGIQLDVNWVVSTPLQRSESTESFYVRGDGLYRHLN